MIPRASDPDLLDSITAERSERVHARARRDDPHTSKVAAKRSRGVAYDHQQAIVGVLWRGMTIYEIAKLTGLTHVQVARRMKELEEAGQARRRVIGQGNDGAPIYATKPGDTGRDCALWERVL